MLESPETACCIRINPNAAPGDKQVVKRKTVMPHPRVKFFCTVFVLVFLCAFPAVPGQAQQDHLAAGYRCVFGGMSPEASAVATFWKEETGKLHYRLEVEHIEDIVMSHLHLGTVEDFGTPVVWLYPPSPPPKLVPGEFSGVLAEGVIEEEDLIGPLRGQTTSELVSHIERDLVYANIHTREHLKGEICGQVRLLEPGEVPEQQQKGAGQE